ncbi:hypothetical protein CTI12_AA478940 [Artemisia annua]|uniref:Uncharacterized protein n=1 Tax=Artemisia annua TaxID=35608 RepID=A0A2U1LLN7_ARTAN|nr:hypothetical protein CTI12_AA478940 [Artemisia annua]
MNLKLQAHVSIEEIHRATKQLVGLKAHNEDGFSGIFYHKYWHLVGDYVFKTIPYFFETGHMLPEINKPLVVLIPKVPLSESLNDSLFFLKASQVECRNLLNIFYIYFRASTQKVNFEKSSAFYSPNTPITMQALKVKLMVLKDKYLGLQSVYGRKK